MTRDERLQKLYGKLAEADAEVIVCAEALRIAYEEWVASTPPEVIAAVNDLFPRGNNRR